MRTVAGDFREERATPGVSPPESAPQAEGRLAARPGQDRLVRGQRGGNTKVRGPQPAAPSKGALAWRCGLGPSPRRKPLPGVPLRLRQRPSPPARHRASVRPAGAGPADRPFTFARKVPGSDTRSHSKRFAGTWPVACSGSGQPCTDSGRAASPGMGCSAGPMWAPEKGAKVGVPLPVSAQAPAAHFPGDFCEPPNATDCSRRRAKRPGTARKIAGKFDWTFLLPYVFGNKRL